MGVLHLLPHLGTFSLLLLALSLFTAFVSWAVMLGLRLARRGGARFWMGPGLVALALLPGAMSVAVAALAFQGTLDGVALTGSGGLAAAAAGSAESLLPLISGFACVAGLAFWGLLLLVAGSSRTDPAAVPHGATAGTLASPLLVVAVLLLAGVLGIAIAGLPAALPETGPTVLRGRVTGIGAAFVALGLLGFALGSALRAPRGAAPLLVKVLPPLSLALAGVLSVGAVVLLGGRLERLTEVALTGSLDGKPSVAELEAPGSQPGGQLSSSPEPFASPDLEDQYTPPPPPPPPPPAKTRRTPSPAVDAAPRGGQYAAPSPARETSRTRPPVRIGGRIPEPRKLKNVAPVYPDIAKQARVQGVVILECTIDERGRVKEVKVLRGIPLLDGAAIDAVKQWVYSPTLLDGVPVPVIMTVTINFKLS